MRRWARRVVLAGLAASALTGCSNKTEAPKVAETFDPKAHLYLEEIEGGQALDWARKQNERSLGVLQADPRYQTFHAAAYAIQTSKERIPMGAIRDGYVYNFWTDDANPLGLWRRTKLADYVAKAPKWEVLLDVDALSKAEGRKWVYKGVSCLPSNHDLCLVTLAEGGKDASVYREFDVSKKAFVKGGFDIPEAKSNIEWGDKDTLLIATDWGEGSLTPSGYPFITKALKRGQKLSDAAEVFRGEKTDVSSGPFTMEDAAGKVWKGALRGETFFESSFVVFPEKGGAPLALPIPKRSTPRGLYRDMLLVTLEQDWTPAGQDEFKTGDLIAFKWSEFVSPGNTAGKLPKVELVLRPTSRQAVQSVDITKSAVLVTLSDNVVPKVFVWTKGASGWSSSQVALPDTGSAAVAFADMRGDQVFLTYESYLSPDTLYIYDVSAKAAPKPIMSLPAWFDAANMVAEQFEATSSDGVKVPYFVVHRKDIKLDGTNPTLLYAYGGFQVSYPPAYSATMGKLWLEQGGVYALANIRGGGEFGPAWHEAGLKTNRMIVYDDFTSVAKDLIARKITSPQKLGAMGGSNGGLLMGVMFTQHPELFKAIVCQVPLLDMIAFTHLGAGASWVGEYGDPDDKAHPEERAFLEKLSPYHNVHADKTYPEIFLETSTKDDRVHPAHARKMGKRLEDLGKPFLYYENIDGGHAAASTPEEVARRSALEYVYLSRKLIDGK